MTPYMSAGGLEGVTRDMDGVQPLRNPRKHLLQEFTKGGLVKGGLAIYVLLLYHHC